MGEDELSARHYPADGFPGQEGVLAADGGRFQREPGNGERTAEEGHTISWFEAVAAVTAPEGLAILNLAVAGPSSTLEGRLASSLAAAFPHVSVLPAAGLRGNVLFLASRSRLDPLQTSAAVLATAGREGQSFARRLGTMHEVDPAGLPEPYTDDRAPVETDVERMLFAGLF